LTDKIRKRDAGAFAWVLNKSGIYGYLSGP
jgi:hypothetical protein